MSLSGICHYSYHFMSLVLGGILQRVSLKVTVLGWTECHIPRVMLRISYHRCLVCSLPALYSSIDATKTVIVHQASVERYMNQIPVVLLFETCFPENRSFQPRCANWCWSSSWPCIPKNIYLEKKSDIGSTKLLSISPMTRDLLRPRGRSHAWPPGKRRNGLTTRDGSLSAAKKTLRRVASKEHGRSTSPKPIPLTTSAWCLDDLTKAVPGCHSKKRHQSKGIKLAHLASHIALSKMPKVECRVLKILSRH